MAHNSGSKAGMSKTAIDARREYNREWNRKNREKRQEYNRRYWEKKAAEAETLPRNLAKE